MPEKREKFVHPYIPNSVPRVQEEMCREIGIKDIEELYADIPESLRFKGEMDLPKPLTSEYDLKKHADKILSKNMTCTENISFLGGGCYQHFVPAICDEINSRSEFLTAYAGEPYEDHGRFQTLFEYAGMMGEMLNMDVVNVPTYDWGQAASTSIRMAGRITGRKEVLVSSAISADRLLIIKNYCKYHLSITMVGYDKDTGKIDIDDIKAKISEDTAGIYFENPSFFGCIDDQGQKISDIAHDKGAICIVGADPISLGVLVPPADYGADIVCGDIQSLGMHMQYGGGQAGYIATHDKESFVMEYPSRLFGIETTSKEGEWGFGDVKFDRVSFAHRDDCKEFIGTATALWGITAGVYLALMGPQGMYEVGKLIVQKTRYAMKKISEIGAVKLRFPKAASFREFVVDFTETGKSVKEINEALLKEKIFGGLDISEGNVPMVNCALYCITEIHTKEDIDTLAGALKKVLR